MKRYRVSSILGKLHFMTLNHSDAEDREILVGHSEQGRLLTVSYTFRDNAIRVISARKATHREAKDYARRI